MMHTLLPIYIGPAAVLAILGALLFIENGYTSMKDEGRAVLGIFCGLIWPLLLLIVVLWACLSFFRGLAQIFRLVFPKRRKK